jgi:VWFA-related protein
MTGKISTLLMIWWFLLVPTGFLLQENKVTIEPRAKKPDAKELGKSPNIRVDTTLVAVDATVVDPLNRLVMGLEIKNFRLFEDNVEQKIEHLSVEEIPISVCLVFDISGSMGEKLKKSRDAAVEFFKTANPEDEFCLIQFGDTAELVVNFTKDISEIQNKLMFSQSKGKTALLDAVYLAVNNMKKTKTPRKAIIIISDGGDNNSRYIAGEIKSLVRESDVQIYSLGIYETNGNQNRTSEEAGGPQLLTDIAEQTGGRHFGVGNPNDLPDIALKIGMELHDQYVLYFNPTNKNKDGKYRKLRIKMIPPPMLPDIRVYARAGYYAPIQ